MPYKMTKLKIIFVLSCFVSYLYGQDDSHSKKILDEVAAKFKNYPCVQIDFSMTVAQLQNDSEITHKGKIWLKSDKYKLEIPENTLYFDGTKLYHYMSDVKEVNVSRPDMDDNEELQMFNPKTFFNFSSKNFKSDLVKESTQYGRRVMEINLYPVDIKSSGYSRIGLYVEKGTSQIVYLKAVMKNGTRYTLTFSPYNILKALPDAFFIFNASEHPGVEVIDLTF